jgi:hypothetical protein
MKLTLALTVLSVLWTTIKRVEMLGCERHNNRTLRTFIIDLDKPPREHFKETTLAFKPYILKFSESIKFDLCLFRLIKNILFILRVSKGKARRLQVITNDQTNIWKISRVFS